LLRRTLLAAAASDRLHQAVITAPQTRAIVDRYVAGDTTSDAVGTARALRAAGLLVSLDYLGEDTTDAGQAAAVAATYVGLLGDLSAAGLAGGGGCEVSVKATAVGLFLPDHGEKTAAENIARICTAARNAGTTVTLDAEDHTAVGPTLRIAAELRADFPDLGCVVQSRLRRTEADCEQLAAAGARVRLCKGAYDEPPDVAFSHRREVDLSYVRCLKLLMAGSGYPMLATHDPRLIDIATALALLTGRPADRFEYQMLYGIRADEQQRLADAGSQVRVYVPYGSDWYGYLVRRLAERPGNLAFFLRSLAPARRPSPR
jgi:proline dehydrogenase